MPPKRGHVGGSSAKTPTQPRTKHTRRVNSPAASNALVGTQTATAAVALTGLKDPSHFNSEDVDPSLIVDYNESTPLPSPHSSDADNELMRKDNGELLPIQTSLMAHNMETATFTNAVSSSALDSAATFNESAAHKGGAASPVGIATTPYAHTIIQMVLT